MLAAELRRRILNGEFPEGTALPTERDLVEQTTLSRASVREAIRALEVQDLVTIRTGRSGGAFVHRPNSESMAASVRLLIQGSRLGFSTLLEAREGIEPFCALLAARHRTDDDLDELIAINDRLSQAADLENFLAANVDWHVAVAKASHNEIIEGLMLALAPAIHTATDNEAFVDDEVMHNVAKAHTAVTRAIEKQNESSAERSMANHIHAYAVQITPVEVRTRIELDR